VLLDTLVVRSILVTALNLELGDRIWWPSRPPVGKTAPVRPHTVEVLVGTH
jgi:RND superfamily putative drug exporter